MTPGNDPFEQLRQALGRVATTTLPDVVDALSRSALTLDEIVRRVVPPGTNVVVVVDQFEELFTHTIDEGARRAFVQMLVDTAAEPDAVVRIVVTLRADFLDRPLGYAGLRRRHQGTHDRPRRDVGGRAGRGGPPAGGRRGRRRRAGARRPDHRRGRRRTWRAAARPAPDGRALRPADGERAHPRRLRGIGRSGRRHRAARRSDLCRARRPLPIGGPGSVPPPRQRGRGARGHPPPRAPHRTGALRGSAPTSSTWCCASTAATGCSRSIAMRPPGHRRSKSPTRRCSANGPACKDWIDDARDDLLTRRRIESAAHDWLAAGSDASFLFTGGRLELAESWAAESAFELTEDEQRFLTASRTRVDRDTAARARRRRRITQVLVGAVVVTAAVAAYALVQRSAADREARETRARELAGQAQLAIEEDPERAIMLALAASDETSEPLPESVSALQAATQSMRLVDMVDGVGDASLAYSPDGSMVAVDRAEGASRLSSSSIRRTATCWPRWRPDTHRAWTVWPSIRAAPSWPWPTRALDGAPAIGRFEVPSGRAAGGFSGPAGLLRAALVPPGRTLARGGAPGRRRRTETGDRRLGRRLPGHPDLARARDRVRLPPRHHVGGDRRRRRPRLTRRRGHRDG